MGFSRNEIIDLRFSTSRDGYDKEEVESFLDALAEDLSVRERERQQLKQRLAALSAELRKTQAQLKQGAERWDKDSDADAEARELIEQARLQAKMVLDRAKSEAQTIVQEAKEQGELIITRKKQEQAGELRLRPLSQRMYSSFVGVDPRFAQNMPVEAPQAAGLAFEEKPQAPAAQKEGQSSAPAQPTLWPQQKAPDGLAEWNGRRFDAPETPPAEPADSGQSAEEKEPSFPLNGEVSGQEERKTPLSGTEAAALRQEMAESAPPGSGAAGGQFGDAPEAFAPQEEAPFAPEIQRLGAEPRGEAHGDVPQEVPEEPAAGVQLDGQTAGQEEPPASRGNIIAFPGAAATAGQSETDEPAQQDEASVFSQPQQEPEEIWSPEELRDPEPPEEPAVDPWELPEGEYPQTDWLSDPERRYEAQRPWEEDPDL